MMPSPRHMTSSIHFVDGKGNRFRRTIDPLSVIVIALMLLKCWNHPPPPTPPTPPRHQQQVHERKETKEHRLNKTNKTRLGANKSLGRQALRS